jgi:hypothetical protein
MAVLLFYVAWRPQEAQLILQWLALAVIVFLATQIPFIGPVVILLMIPFLLVLAAYPERRSLLQAPWRDGVDRPLLALGLLVTIVLLPGAVAALLAQVRAEDDLAVHYNWASNAEHLVNLGLAALLASMRKTRSRPAGLDGWRSPRLPRCGRDRRPCKLGELEDHRRSRRDRGRGWVCCARGG